MQKRFNPLKPDAPASKPKPAPLKKGDIPNPLPVGPPPVLTENEQKDGLELRFPKQPGPALLEFFHSTKDLPSDQRWHFHFKKKFWYAKRNEVTRKFAEVLIALARAQSTGPSSAHWVEKFIEARGDAPPQPVEASSNVSPVQSSPVSVTVPPMVARAAWRRRHWLLPRPI